MRFTVLSCAIACGALAVSFAAYASDPVPLSGVTAKNSYAVGASLGGSVRQLTIEMDQKIVLQGFEDALSGSKLLMSAEDVRATVMQLQREAKEKKGLVTKAVADKNLREGEAFLAANKGQNGVVVLPSGLQYRILKAGKGNKPTLQDNVVCHYRGTLIDGTEFDSSYTRQQPTTFSVARVIKGWTEALQLMTVGSKWQLFVPGILGYGERGSGRIGPNATLIFEVELIAIQGQ